MTTGKSPYTRYNKRPYVYTKVWEKYPYLRPGAQGVGAKKKEVDVDLDAVERGRGNRPNKRALREIASIKEAHS